MSTFKLDKSIFAPSLYRKIQDVWFEGQTPDKKDLNFDVIKKWFNLAPEEAKVFDNKCRDHFQHALESIGPKEFPNPTADPFVEEVSEMMQQNPADDGAEAVSTALSILILLDQMPRNIYRTNDGLKLVYGHYDRIAQSLVDTLLFSTKSPIPRPDLHPRFRRSLAHRYWFYLPLMHSEDMESHQRLQEINAQIRQDMDEDKCYQEQKIFFDQGSKSEEEHVDIIRRFGRYPHRNGALGRKTTPEEERFLSEGGATFGVAQTKA